MRLFAVALLVLAACASAPPEVSEAPAVDVGELRGGRERAVIFHDGSATARAAARVWTDFFVEARELPRGSVTSWPADRRASRRLNRATDYVPVGGRLWMVWLAGEGESLTYDDAVRQVAEGPHREAVVIDHRCPEPGPPATVRWRGERAQYLDVGPVDPGVMQTWRRADTPVNVGFVALRCDRGPERAARSVVAELARADDATGDGLFGLRDLAYAATSEGPTVVSVSGIDLVLGPSQQAARRRPPSAGPTIALEPAVHLPTGTFARGCVPGDEECEDDESPPQRIWLSGFAVDRNEVTWGEYAECVLEGGCPAVGQNGCYVYDPAEGFRREPLDPRAIDPQAPMTCATWSQARALCQWRGKDLPTETQWERAARGVIEAVHQWSDAPPRCEEAIHDGCADAPQPAAADARTNTAGIADLVGNVSEWTLDWYDELAYEHRHHVRNPRGPPQGDVKVVRGGSFYDPPTFLRLSYRYGLSPQFGYDIVGFRCVR